MEKRTGESHQGGGGRQRGDGTEEMSEKPKSPYNLSGVGGGVRRES